MTAPRFLNRRMPLAMGAVVLAACAGLTGLFARGGDHIIVPHARHAKADVDCATCHETIFESTNLTTVDLPTEKKCLSCHKEEKQKGNCAFCHTSPEHPKTYSPPKRELKMNHAEHIERVKEDCSVCHTSLPEPLVTQVTPPTMDSCLNCHEHKAQYEAGNCSVCHQDLTKYPLKPVASFSHRGDFLKRHGNEAHSAGAACETCHEQTFCSECHAKTVSTRIEAILPERVDRAFIHRNDFLSRHPVEARADETSCARCHGTDFCISCHTKNGLVPGAASGLEPHPAGFGQGSQHGPAARRDINSCASCHDQGAASNCVSCHRVNGVGGNPHPPSFTARHPREEITRNAMCQICHL